MTAIESFTGTNIVPDQNLDRCLTSIRIDDQLLVSPQFYKQVRYAEGRRA